MGAQKTYKLTYEYFNTVCEFETIFYDKLIEKLNTLKESHEVNKQSITINTVTK